MKRWFMNKLKKVKDNRSKNSGLTLIELLVSITILSLIVFPTMQVFVAATEANSKARTKLQATITANSLLESAKAFTIANFEEQCYGSDELILIAGNIVDGEYKTFTEYGGTAGLLELDGTKFSKIRKRSTDTDKIRFPRQIATTVMDDGEEKEVVQILYDASYAYIIKGIRQSNQRFDAIVIFERDTSSDNSISLIDGTSYSTTDAQTEALNDKVSYEMKYKITVLVYSSKLVEDTDGTMKPAYECEKDGMNDILVNKNKALVTLTGSKLQDITK